MAMVHGYWNIRGYGQPIRLLLAQAGVEYVDKRYNYGSTPETLRTDWLNDKFNLGLDFPNLPYLFDGDIKITQSIAILRYLGRKYNLVPKTAKEGAVVDMIEQELLDWRSQQSGCFYNADHENLKAAYIDGLKGKVKSLSTFLGNKEWLSGGALTYVDFLAYEWIEVNRTFYPELLNGADNLVKYQTRVESLPNIAAYMKSDKFLKYPFNGVSAQWGK